MLAFEVEINPEYTGELAARIMSVWPGSEVTISEKWLSFAVPLNGDLDKRLSRLEEALQKFEATRNATDITVRSRNLCGPDAVSEVLRIGDLEITTQAGKSCLESNRKVIFVDAGMAFGTGGHPSTKLTLTALEEFFTPPPGAPTTQGSRVLDVGTGSGILALAAARLGAGKVTAIDPVQDAIEAASRNISQNGFESIIEIAQITAESVTDRYNLILANLVPSVLLKSLKNIVPLLEGDGIMIVAGFSDSQAPQIVKALTKKGLVSQKTYSRNGWTALKLIKAG
jgi:ribosomal protein L11 methylase PrmA